MSLALCQLPGCARTRTRPRAGDAAGVHPYADRPLEEVRIFQSIVGVGLTARIVEAVLDGGRWMEGRCRSAEDGGRSPSALFRCGPL